MFRDVQSATTDTERHKRLITFVSRFNHFFVKTCNTQFQKHISFIDTKYTFCHTGLHSKHSIEGMAVCTEVCDTLHAPLESRLTHKTKALWFLSRRNATVRFRIAASRKSQSHFSHDAERPPSGEYHSITSAV